MEREGEMVEEIRVVPMQRGICRGTLAVEEGVWPFVDAVVVPLREYDMELFRLQTDPFAESLPRNPDDDHKEDTKLWVSSNAENMQVASVDRIKGREATFHRIVARFFLRTEGDVEGGRKVEDVGHVLGVNGGPHARDLVPSDLVYSRADKGEVSAVPL